MTSDAASATGDRAPRARTAHGPLLLILLLYVALAVSYSLATPIGEAPDEPTHVEYVLYLLRERSFPVLPIEEEGLAQAKHPPLYYLAAAAVSAWADMSSLGFVPNPHFTFNLEAPSSPNAFVHFPFARFPYTDAEGLLAVRLMRLVSIACGTVVVAATYALGRALWPGRRYLHWGSAAAVAFLPGFLFMSGVVNNDNMANAFSALVLVGAVRVAMGHVSRRDLLLLGVALGLGLLTKLTIVAALGVAGLGVLAHAYRTRQPRWLLSAAFWVGGPVVATFGPWIVRNVRTYGPADPLGWTRWQAKIPQMARTIPLGAEIEAYFWTQLTTFWARFGWATLSLPDVVYHVLLLAMGLAVLGLLVIVARDRDELSADTRWGLALTAVAAVLFYASVFRLAFTFNLVVAHGRYLYIAAAAFGVLFVTGITRLLPPRARPWGAFVLASALLALSLVSLTRYVMPAFAAPAPATADEIERIERASGAVLDGKLRLVGYDLSADRIAPGDTLTATLYWAATDANWDPFPPSPAGHTAFVHAVDADGEVVARVDAAPFDGAHPTGAWTPGAVWPLRHSLAISPSATPGESRLLAGWHAVDEPDRRLEAVLDGVDIGDAVPLGPIVLRNVTSDEASETRGVEQGDRFGRDGQITLLRADVAGTAESGYDVTLVWRSESAVPDDDTVFVHAIDGEGRVLATGDGAPQDGRYRTSLWAPGDIVVDVHRIPALPTATEAAGAPPPTVERIAVGLYDLDTGARRPAFEPDGARWPDDAVILRGWRSGP